MTATTAPAPSDKSLTQRLLDGVERVGNKVPHPALMFLYLIIGVIVLSAVLSFLNVSVTDEALDFLAEVADGDARRALNGLEVAAKSIDPGGTVDLAVAQESVHVAEVQVDNTEIRAPFSGIVVAKAAQPGEMISPISAGGGFTRTGIGTIVDMDSLEVQVDVNESFINRVAPGQAVEAVLNAYPDWKIPGEVIAIIPAADRNKATVKVRVALKQKDPRIVPDAEFIEKISYMDVLKRDLRVMDTTAISMCRDNDLPIVVFDICRQGAVRAILSGESVGSTVGA